MSGQLYRLLYFVIIILYYIVLITIVAILFLSTSIINSALAIFTKQILDYVVDNEGIADFSVKQFIVGHINTQAKDDRVLETISIEKQTAIYYYSGYIYSLNSNFMCSLLFCMC